MNGVRAQHLDWLSLVDVEGQFLSLGAIRNAFPGGLDAVPAAVRAEARARLEIVAAEGTDAARASWIDWLFRGALGWGERYQTGDEAAKIFDVPEYRSTVRAAGALVDPRNGQRRAVVLHVPYRTSFDQRLPGETWSASPLERVALLARENAVQIALLEDGERVALLNVPPEGSGGYATWQTDLFADGAERTLFASFVGLLDARRFFNVMPEHELTALFTASVVDGSELTKSLGFQVRRAVELFVAALSSVDRDGRRRLGRGLLNDVAPHQVYVAAATVMMRAIFLLFAEERGLLPLADPLYARSYAISTLREQVEAERLELGDEPLERRCTAWRRMLATFGAIYTGIEHDGLRLPAYGGRLFDPKRFPFLLEARIDDLTIATILSALQILGPERGGTARHLSFRELDVEQIGHVYEGLLDHDARAAVDVVLGFNGKAGDEPEVDLASIEAAAKRGRTELTSFLRQTTGRTESAVTRDLERGDELARLRDADTVRRVRRACENDVEIAERVLPYAPLMRDDLHGVPTVFLAGSLLVRKTRARRDSGTEYTPRSLAEEIVQHTLEPLCFHPGPVEGAPPETWILKSSDELLNLKLCDPACGSGAFLVAACRYLGDRVAEAWAIEQRFSDDDPAREAQRLVAQRCIYGVDRDGMAVEMAKLSLWLLTFARERPFSFLDHAIREGDSLLGITSFDQVRFLHRDPERGKSLHHTLFEPTALLEKLLDDAAELRKDLSARAILDARDAEEQAKLEAAASERTRTARVIADSIVGVELSLSELQQSQRDLALSLLADQIAEALRVARDSSTFEETFAEIHNNAIAKINAGRPMEAPVRVPFHWPLEFPEIFMGDRAGFDAAFGNPPFLGGQFITGRYGTDYRNHLLNTIAAGRRGSADLVAYFLLRVAEVAPRFGMIATNTISQGSTREVALDALLSNGWHLVRAVKSRLWPGAAALQVAEVWCTMSPSSEAIVLDNQIVSGISPLLVPLGRESVPPQRLAANMSIAFQGSLVLGMGFIMTLEEAREIIDSDPSSADVLFPYLNADNVCNSPTLTAPRYIVNFFDWTQEKARTFSVFERVERLVRPERQRRRPDGSFVTRGQRSISWWKYAEQAKALYSAIDGLKHVIVMPLVSKYSMPVLVQTRQVFAHRLAVFASSDSDLYGQLSSGLHHAWVRHWTSTLETRTNYSPTDCFETFPLAPGDERIGAIMREIHEFRAALMPTRNEGITVTYNRFHDRACADVSIARLRELHIELDRRIAAAYLWQDLGLSYDFRETEEGVRYTFGEATRVELLDRLLELNHERHDTEATVQPHGPGKMAPARNLRV